MLLPMRSHVVKRRRLRRIEGFALRVRLSPAPGLSIRLRRSSGGTGLRRGVLGIDVRTPRYIFGFFNVPPSQIYLQNFCRPTFTAGKKFNPRIFEMNIGSDEGLAVKTGPRVPDQAALGREDFKAALRAEWTLGTDWAEIAMRHIEAARSIPAAAALLRAAGWRVEEPRCGMCSGNGTFWHNDIIYDCPTCNGTGAAKGDGR